MNELALISKLEVANWLTDDFSPASVRVNLTASELVKISVRWTKLLDLVRSNGNLVVKVWEGNWIGLSRHSLPSKVCHLFGLEVNGDIEGLILISTCPKNPTNLNWNSQVIEVEFVESAPWNNYKYMKDLNRQSKYGYVGTCLIAIASAFSFMNNEGGVLILTAVRSAVKFYLDLGFQIIATDPVNGSTRMILDEARSLTLLEGIL